MIIKNPIYYVVIEGNFKQPMSELSNVIVVSYEEHINKTFVVLKGSEKDETEDVLKYIRKVCLKLSKNKKSQIKVKYSKEGINFKITNNN